MSRFRGGSNAAFVAELQRRFARDAALVDLDLSLVRRSRVSRSGDLLEFRSRDGAEPREVVVLHAPRSSDAGRAAARFEREFARLAKLRARVGGELRRSLPDPLLLIPELGALVMEKLPGRPLDRILQREANVLAGRYRGERLCGVAEQVGGWLREFHESTRQAPLLHDAPAFLAGFDAALARVRDLEARAAEEIREIAARLGADCHGAEVAAAGRHGDFIPQNILVHEARLGVVDFENFADRAAVYEDLATLAAYLSMLSRNRLYRTATLEHMVGAFLQGYGTGPRDELYRTYLLRQAVEIAAYQRPQQLWKNLLARRSASDQLLVLARRFT